MKFHTFLMVLVLFGFVLPILSEVVEACNFDSDCPTVAECHGDDLFIETYECVEGNCLPKTRTTTTCEYGCSGGDCNPCTPITSCGSVECGTISDGCGGTLNCGSCPSPSSTCSGDTVVTTSYTCEGGTCEPTRTTKYCSDVSRCDGNTYVYQDRWCSGGSCHGGTTYNTPCGSDGCSNGIYYDRGCDPDDGCFAHPKDGDSSETYCNCCSSCDWNIGGEVSATTCCGDDPNEYVLGGAKDNTLDPYLISSDLKACCNSATDCVYNNECYQSDRQGPDVDQDGDYDWCGYPGTWRDCNTDAQCGGGTVFGEYEVCRTNDCKVDCYNKPCVAGYPECVDEISEETLYCMNSTFSASQSSHVENPAGGNTNERYCRQDEYYDPIVGSCQPKYGEDICYNYLDPDECGTGNTASVVDCNLVGEYCSFDTGEYENIEKIEPTNDPLNGVGTGLLSPTTTGGCIETDSGDKPKEWGCVYIMNAENNIDDDFQIVAGEMGCDYVSGGNLIEFYCSGDEISAKNYTCEKIIKTEDNTSYCFKNPSDSRSITPPTRKTPKKSCTPNCEGKECGGDGCGGSCGSCASGEICSWGQCVVSCTPSTCSGLGIECGTASDGCGGTLNCGTCDLFEICEKGKCVISGGGPTPPIKPPGYGLT
ncbi:MAG: hypothetical protein PWQ28_279 [Candidatus Woesearchaeota archaeon]|nr:hypothetical protein [Candidatus Woesearchaeota archaeon]